MVEEYMTSDLEEFPQLQALLGTTIERLFERTENRLIWEFWLQISELPDVLVPHSDEEEEVPAWIDKLDDHLHEHARRLLAYQSPHKYRYRQEAQDCIKTIREQRTQRLIRQLGQQAHDIDDPDEKARIETLLKELQRYRAHISRPKPNNFYDGNRRETR
jgi:hypothetical protein